MKAILSKSLYANIGKIHHAKLDGEHWIGLLKSPPVIRSTEKGFRVEVDFERGKFHKALYERVK